MQEDIRCMRSRLNGTGRADTDMAEKKRINAEKEGPPNKNIFSKTKLITKNPF